MARRLAPHSGACLKHSTIKGLGVKGDFCGIEVIGAMHLCTQPFPRKILLLRAKRSLLPLKGEKLTAKLLSSLL